MLGALGIRGKGVPEKNPRIPKSLPAIYFWTAHEFLTLRLMRLLLTCRRGREQYVDQQQEERSETTLVLFRQTPRSHTELQLCRAAHFTIALSERICCALHYRCVAVHLHRESSGYAPLAGSRISFRAALDKNVAPVIEVIAHHGYQKKVATPARTGEQLWR
jgi:hypothetical protein